MTELEDVEDFRRLESDILLPVACMAMDNVATFKRSKNSKLREVTPTLTLTLTLTQTQKVRGEEGGWHDVQRDVIPLRGGQSCEAH